MGAPAWDAILEERVVMSAGRADSAKFLADHVVEHQPDGRAHYLLRVADGAPTPVLARSLPVLEQAVASTLRGSWGVLKAGCWSCGLAWAAVLAPGCSPSGLECVGCGERAGVPVEVAWCASCGAEHECVREPGCAAEGIQCPVCRKMAAMVDAA